MRRIHSRDEIIEIGRNRGIEVRFAKTKEEVRLEGVHLLEPTIEQLLDGIISALMYGTDLVTVHSKLTWPAARDYLK